MFSKSDKPATAGKTRRGPAIPSLVSADLQIEGSIRTEGEIQLEGMVNGDIHCGKLIIGEGARVTGEINAESVVVRGRVTGKINARSVELTRTARVKGDILHQSMAIEAGAFLEGMCIRMDNLAEADKEDGGISDTQSTAAAKAPSVKDTASNDTASSQLANKPVVVASDDANEAVGSTIRQTTQKRKLLGT